MYLSKKGCGSTPLSKPIFKKAKGHRFGKFLFNCRSIVVQLSVLHFSNVVITIVCTIVGITK